MRDYLSATGLCLIPFAALAGLGYAELKDARCEIAVERTWAGELAEFRYCYGNISGARSEGTFIRRV